jgi:hypothetical protein
MNQFQYNPQMGVIRFFNGSEIILKDLELYPSDPEFDSLGSLEISGAFVDEVSQLTYKAWQIVKSRIRYKLKEFNITPKILGTCNPTKNWVYREFYNPFRNASLKAGRAFVQALPTDNPHLPETYLKSLLSLDDASRQRLYYGNWEYDDDPAKLIEFEAIQSLWKNDHVKPGSFSISADIARFGSDSGVIVVWEGLRVLEIKKLDGLKTTETAKAIFDYCRKYQIPKHKVICDEDGVGGGVVDTLGCVGFVNNASPLREEGGTVQYQNLKSQCYFKLADHINRGRIHLTKPFSEFADSITQELEQVKRHNVDKDGKLQIIPKELVKQNIGRSPDFSDALMMRMYFEIHTTRAFVLT